MDLGPFYALTNVVILVALVCITGRLWGQRPEFRRSIGLAVGGSILWSIAWLGWLGSQSLPVELLNPIQEGTTHKNIQHVYGQAAHVGPNFRWLLGVYAELDGGVFPSLRMTVGLNSWLGGINACFMAAISLGVLGHLWGALAMTLGYMTSIVFIQASLSTGAGQLLSLYFFIGFVLAAAMNVLEGRRERGLILLGMVAVLTAAVNTRLEFLAAAVLCGGMAFARWCFSDDRVDRFVTAGGKFIRSGLQKCGHYGERRWVWGAVFLLGVFWALFPLRFSEMHYWEAAVSPFYVRSLVYLPVVLTMMIPPAIVALFVLGIWYSFFRLKRFFLLPILVTVLFNSYYVASHNGSPAEMTRYMTLWLPMIFVLALFGWCELRDLAKRFSWHQGWPVVALLILGILVTPELEWAQQKQARDLSHALSPLEVDSHVEGRATRFRLGLGDQQAEVVFLVKLSEDRPDCIIASVVTYNERCSVEDRSCDKDTRSIMLMGGPLGGWEEHPLDGQPVEAVRTAVNGRAGCVLLYEGLDHVAFHGSRMSVADFSTEGLSVARSAWVDERHYNLHLPNVRPVWLTAFDLPLDTSLSSSRSGLNLP